MIGTTTKHFSDIIRYVTRQFGDESGTQITTADILDWTNQGQRELCSLAKIIEVKASTDIVAGTYEYSLPTLAATDIVSIRYNGVPLTGISFQNFETEYQEADPTKTATGVPQIWTMWGNTITLWPAPNTNVVAGLTVYYIGVPADLTTPGDLLSVPDTYYEALCFFALSKAYELDEDYQTAKEYSQRFRERMGDEYDRTDEPEMFYPSITFTDWE